MFNDLQKIEFENCISLGWFCGTAGSMAKLGLRSFSGPFDWYFSNYESVIKMIDTEFDDFLNIRNLQVNPQNPKRFNDLKYDFEYIHDVTDDFYKEYDIIHEKYLRRIKRFLRSINEPTLFFRTVKDPMEKEFIISNNELINNTIKHYNEYNRIVYLFSGKVGQFPEKLSIPSFELNIDDYSFDPASTRNMFDKSPELIDFCKGLYTADRRKSNIVFDKHCNESSAADIYRMIVSGDLIVKEELLNSLNCSDSEGLYLWGCGFHGKEMYKYLDYNGVYVKGLIDSKREGEVFENHTIVSPLNIEDGSKIFISIADEKAVNSIKGTLASKYKDIDICDYNKLKDLIIQREQL